MSKDWYMLQTFTGYEGKIERTIKSLLDKNELDKSVILTVLVPEEKVKEVRNGKEVTRTNKFLPGYVMLEMDLPEFGWRDTCARLYKIQGVGGFVGVFNKNNRPFPIKKDEAKNLLQRSGLITGEKQVVIKHSFNIGDTVKIIEGPFASFNGVIKEIFADKEKLSAEVQIFGRPTPVELTFAQAEKI